MTSLKDIEYIGNYILFALRGIVRSVLFGLFS